MTPIQPGAIGASAAHVLAYERAARPKPAKLVTNQALSGRVQADLHKRYSPEQIAGRLQEDFPDDPEMWVSHETIYQSLYVQSRGALRRELTKCLRTGRALRVPNRQGTHRKNRILPDMINISERPAEANDRAVPGHWEGDLIIGKRNASAIGTLVERSTGYTMLVHLPDGYKPEQVAPALAAKIQTLPAAVRRSLTWDQGREMRDWKQVEVTADIAIFFRDPHKPWQRHEREHQRAAAPVLPQGQRPVRALRVRSRLGRAEQLRTLTLDVYRRAAEKAASAGIILADNKLEFGIAADGTLVLADEVHTPDSSRFWPADGWQPGRAQPSYDQQFARDWLIGASGWDRTGPPPPLPDAVVEQTRAKYVEAFERLTGRRFEADVQQRKPNAE